MSRRRKDPSYRLHKQSGKAIITLPDSMGGRRDVLLGEYDSQQSWDEYNRILAEWKSNDRRLPVPTSARSDLTVNELVLAYWRFVETYYVKDGKPTSEQDTIRQALRFVRHLYGSSAAHDFGPLALKAVRQAMVEHPVTRNVKVADPVTREAQVEVR